MTVVTIEFVDYTEDFFGKVVAKTDVRGMTEAEVKAEVAEMTEMLGDHIVAREVDVIGPA